MLQPLFRQAIGWLAHESKADGLCTNHGFHSNARNQIMCTTIWRELQGVLIYIASQLYRDEEFGVELDQAAYRGVILLVNYYSSSYIWAVVIINVSPMKKPRITAGLIIAYMISN